MNFQHDIEQALRVLKEGGTILYPTDTIWGIGCDPTNPDAVRKVYELKQREDSKSMLVLIDDDFRLPSYIDSVPDIAYELIDVADKPLSIIYPGAKNLAENLVAEDGSIGIRITSDPFCKQLIRRFNRPLVSTSANSSGDSSPAMFSDVSDRILESIDYVVQWRQDDITPAQASSIIKLDHAGRITIIRK